jgi:hypothetical protein
VSSLWGIHLAAYNRWKTEDAGVVALVAGRVFDGSAPADTPTPYIVVGDQTERPQDTLGRAGYSSTTTAHVFSSYRGRREVTQALLAMNRAVELPLQPEGFAPVTLSSEFVELLVEEDETRHLVVRYRAFALGS